ncbi:MAG: UDP-N-acetylmuramoyl-L-alanyl-D-glutamate--2,6-diaminopimelate ligase [Clostridia bacterium]|jgi:UDP-N-acetylmuramoyl-L-alanyl-D-glutamate--2,6-diaminopimelate ligase
MTRVLSDLLPAIDPLSVQGNTGINISGLAYDSREVGPGFLFFALPGLHVDGHAHIDDAIRRGAAAIVHSRELADRKEGLAWIKVADTRFAMSPIADAYWNSPSRSLVTIGVTGTEGKSTTVWLIYRLLDLAGKKAGFISTVEYRVADKVLPNPEHQTTPEAITIQAKLAQMLANGLEYAVLESSSHGLSPKTNRLGDIAFDVGVMTNVRHEHLEFHGSWEQYRSDKANLFRRLGKLAVAKTIAGATLEPPRFGVVCLDDPSAAFFMENCPVPVYSYSMRRRDATMYATDIRPEAAGFSFTIHTSTGTGHSTGGGTGIGTHTESYDARIQLSGEFNVENVLAAVLTVSRLTGKTVDSLLPLLPLLEPVKGRMTRIDAGQPFEVLVDYAHTPSSFQAILPPLKKRATGKVISVFGSGGERDTLKRPEQGRIASEYCDIVILSDEDPRGEIPMDLLEDIAAGCGSKERGKDLFLIPDRAMAIRQAFKLATQGDTVLLLGKGHENSIIYASGTISWDEISEAYTALAEAGYERKHP